MTPDPPPKPAYHVTVHPVQEVTLFGTVDASYWRNELAQYALHPSIVDGHAEMIVSSTRARFMGKTFRELSFSVFVSNIENAEHRDGVFMFQAFNSSRFFAWVERTFFHTPYEWGTLEVNAFDKPHFRLCRGGHVLLRGELKGHGPAATQAAEDGWEGPVYLPTKGARRSGPQRIFFGRLSGLTQVEPFDPALDVWEATPQSAHRVFDMLTACNFKPRQWHIRPAATHSKSKTIKRG